MVCNTRNVSCSHLMIISKLDCIPDFVSQLKNIGSQKYMRKTMIVSKK